jgi:hypothetical protein
VGLGCGTRWAIMPVWLRPRRIAYSAFLQGGGINFFSAGILTRPQGAHVPLPRIACTTAKEPRFAGNLVKSNMPSRECHNASSCRATGFHCASPNSGPPCRPCASETFSWLAFPALYNGFAYPPFITGRRVVTIGYRNQEKSLGPPARPDDP